MPSASAEFRTRHIFVQFKCQLGRAYDVAAAIMDNVEECGELFSTSGEYDLIARFNLEAHQDPGLFVTERLQRLDGVAATYTILAFNAFTPNQDPS
ncbi:MAG TPA: Lrp/AsnC ligand binding domain-containing protein [Stellaceae bacterium]|jgi:hypothetical protein|nr:Lrp/AsnC ligand binding domain-containing protein [Stellaceae bacterium]